jgi:class 3 adenylate cyclase/tetratricopeptide (TPR) repeat protein
MSVVRTIIFSDMVDSTLLSDQYGPAYTRALQRHNAIVRKKLSRWQGEEVKFTGDGFLLVFETAIHALHWAVETQAAIRKQRWPEQIPIQMRVGIHTGAIDVLEMPDGARDYVGLPVSKTARICAATPAGGVLVSPTTRDLTRALLPAAFDWEEAGVYEMKGVGEEKLWRLFHKKYLPRTNLPPDAPAPNPVPEPTSPAKPPRTNIRYQRNPSFVGREAELKQIFEWLNRAPQLPLALVGMGGMGKTQLAVEYAHRYMERYPDGVFWFDAQSLPRLQAGYAEIGRLFLDVPDDIALERSVEIVREKLQRLERPSLLIFDNVTKDSELLPFLPKVGQCHLLLTTQLRCLTEGFHPPLDLVRLNEADALTLLHRHCAWQGRASEDAARRIAEMVGYLPLALALVASHIRSLGISYTEYGALLREGTLPHLEAARKHFESATGHSGSIFDTIHLALRSLTTEARAVLQTAACFASRSISDELLCEASALPSRLAYLEARAELRKRSLLIFETISVQDGTGQRLSLHELIRLVLRKPSPSDPSGTELPATFERVRATLTGALQRANLAMEWRAVRQEITHCYSVLEFGKESGFLSGLEDLLRELGIYQGEHGETRRALMHYQEGLVLARQRADGKESLPCAALLRLIGEAQQQAAEPELHQPEAARRNVEEAIRIALLHFAPDSVEMADYYNSLGFVLKSQGELDRAEEHYQRALAIFKSSLEIRVSDGVLWRHVAMCLNNLGALREEQKRLNEALACLQEALTLDRRYEDESPVPVAIRQNNIGRIWQQLGEWKQALACHQEARAIYENAYDSQNRNVAASLVYEGVAHCYLDHAATAEDCFTRSRTLYADALGQQAPIVTLLDQWLEQTRQAICPKPPWLS